MIDANGKLDVPLEPRFAMALIPLYFVPGLGQIALAGTAIVLGGVLIYEETQAYHNVTTRLNAAQKEKLTAGKAKSSSKSKATTPSPQKPKKPKSPNDIIQKISRLIRGTKDITKNVRNNPKIFQKTGGYKDALRDFDKLNLKDIKSIKPSSGGTGKTGKMSDGTTVVVRESSKSDGLTIEFKVDGTILVKIRY